MKKAIFVIDIFLIGAVFVGNWFYLTEGGLLLKGLCSGGFALIGLINLFYAVMKKEANIRFHIFMSIGLCLSMLGDIVLGFHFVIGAAFFAAGHVCYVVAYGCLYPSHRLDIILAGILFAGAGSFILFCPLLTFENAIMQWVCVVYALIISMMVGKAVSNAIRHPGILTVVLAVGSVLFFFSDLMLVFDWFMGLPFWSGKLCMATYYPAQCLLALSLYLCSALHKKIVRIK